MAKSGDLAKRGVVTGEVSLDIEAMMGEKSKAVTALTGGIKMLFKVNITLYSKFNLLKKISKEHQ